MSAYVVNKRHIDALVTGALECGQRDRSRFSWYHEGQRHEVEDITESAASLGALLWRENVKSVQARYPESASDDLPRPSGFDADEAAFYRFEPLAESLTMVELLKAVHGYEYQTCEHAGWPTSEAHAFIEALKDSAINYLDGYSEASTWEVSYDRPVKQVFASYDRRVRY